jgi:hypothetical protein
MARLSDECAKQFAMRGRIGKELVYRKYENKIVVSRYPDRSKIVYTATQKARQGLFAAAVAYARSIVSDPVLKKAYAKKLKNGKRRVYNAAIKEYMDRHRKEE